MEIIKGEVEDLIVDDVEGEVIRELHIGYKSVHEFFRKYEGKVVEVIIREIPHQEEN